MSTDETRQDTGTGISAAFRCARLSSGLHRHKKGKVTDVAPNGLSRVAISQSEKTFTGCKKL